MIRKFIKNGNIGDSARKGMGVCCSTGQVADDTAMQVDEEHRQH